MTRHVLGRVGLAVVASLGLLLGMVVVPAQQAAALEVGNTAFAGGWRPVGGFVYAIARAGDKVILGGQFTSLINAAGTKAQRTNLAAISASTGELLSWAPNPTGAAGATTNVRALAVSDDERTVYVGGTFTSIGSAARTNLAAVSASSGSATAFQVAAPDSGVRALLLDSGTLYVGGTFRKIGATNRGGSAAVDPSTGALKAWNPATNNGVYALVPAPDRSGVFIGGPFTTVGDQTRNYLAKVTSTGAVTSWTADSECVDPDPAYVPPRHCEVLGLAADASTIYAAVGGPGGRAMAFSASSGNRRWQVWADGDMQTVALQGDTLVAGGHFETQVGSAARAGLVALNKSNGRVLSSPSVPVVGGTAVWSLLIDGNLLRVGGQFNSVGDQPIGRYTTFGIVPDPDRVAPSRPGRPTAETVQHSSVALSWTAATDDFGVTEYRVRRDGQQIAVTTSASFVDRSVQPSTTYAYTVVAVDAAGNVSPASDERSVTTPEAPAPTPTPKPTPTPTPKPTPTPAPSVPALKAVTIAVSRSGYGNVLHVNMYPNLGAASFAFKVQKVSAGRWVTLPATYRTLGNGETYDLTLPRGTYRVVVPASGGYANAVSPAVALTDPTVKALVSRNAAKSKLSVNVNPNKGSGYWTFRVQKRNANGTWTTLKTTYKTKGRTETRTVNLKKGTYRVVVAGKYGYKGAASAAVSLVK